MAAVKALEVVTKPNGVQNAKGEAPQGTILPGSIARVERISDGFVKASKPICFILLFGIVVVLLMEIIFRRLPILDVTWSEELAKMLSVGLASIAASTALKQGLHVGAGYLMTKVKNPKLLAFFQLVVQVFISAFLWVVIVYGFIYAANVSNQTAPGVGVSMFWPYLFIPVGAMMMFVHSFFFLLESLRVLKEKPERK